MNQPATKPLLAYAVTEDFETTGGIVFATSAIAARRLGADRYADGEFENVSCKRAPYADKFAETGKVPAGHLIAEGWHFECSRCSAMIDNDYLHEKDIHPEDVIGLQDCAVYCNELCEARENLSEAERKHIQRRWIRRLSRLVKSRFPEAEILADGQWRRPHAYASYRDGKYVIETVTIPFLLPCLKHGPATLEVDRGPIRHKRQLEAKGEQKKSVFYMCPAGDEEAFRAYAKASRPS